VNGSDLDSLTAPGTASKVRTTLHYTVPKSPHSGFPFEVFLFFLQISRTWTIAESPIITDTFCQIRTSSQWQRSTLKRLRGAGSRLAVCWSSRMAAWPLLSRLSTTSAYVQPNPTALLDRQLSEASHTNWRANKSKRLKCWLSRSSLMVPPPTLSSPHPAASSPSPGPSSLPSWSLSFPAARGRVPSRRPGKPMALMPSGRKPTGPRSSSSRSAVSRSPTSTGSRLCVWRSKGGSRSARLWPRSRLLREFAETGLRLLR